MSTPVGRDSLWGFGVQPDINTLPADWYQHYAIEITGGEVNDIRLFDPELGGKAVPTGGYSAGPIAAQQVTFQPRMKGTLGWILKAATGSVTSAVVSGETAVYEHTFKFADTLNLPYFAMRTVMNKSDAAQDLGRVLKGGRIVNLTFTAQAVRPLAAQIGAQFTDWELEDPASWTWANASLEDTSTVPLGVVPGSYIKIPAYSASALPVTGATISLTSSPLRPDDERVYGQAKLDDVTIIGQAVEIRAQVRWRDPQLYRQILTGSPTGTAWSSTVFEHNFDMLALSPTDVTGTATGQKYGIRFSSDRVLWRIMEPPTLGPQNVVMLTLSGVPLDTTNFFNITLYNDQASY